MLLSSQIVSESFALWAVPFLASWLWKCQNKANGHSSDPKATKSCKQTLVAGDLGMLNDNNHSHCHGKVVENLLILLCKLQVGSVSCLSVPWSPAGCVPTPLTGERGQGQEGPAGSAVP